jgi:hypothetical protein
MASLKPRKMGRKKERKKAYAVSLSRLTLSTSEEKETLPNQLTPKLVIAGNITDIYPTPRRQKQHREKEKKKNGISFLRRRIASSSSSAAAWKIYTHKRRPGDWPSKQTAAAVCHHINLMRPL